MNEIERTPVKVAVLNIAAVISGIIATILTNFIILWIFGFLLKIPFVVSIMSFPTTPELYISSIIDFGVIGAGFAVCDAIAPATKTGRKPAISFIGLYCLYCFAMTAYNIFMVEGFRDTVIVNALAALCSIGIIAAGFRKGGLEK